MISDCVGSYLNFYCHPVFSFVRAAQSPTVMNYGYGRVIDMNYASN